MPVVSLPSSRTSPALGVSWPSTQLKRVDFPEPFGPIMPRISPSRTSNDTSSTAEIPPKRLLKLATSKTALMAGSLPDAAPTPERPWRLSL